MMDLMMNEIHSGDWVFYKTNHEKTCMANVREVKEDKLFLNTMEGILLIDSDEQNLYFPVVLVGEELYNATNNTVLKSCFV